MGNNSWFLRLLWPGWRPRFVLVIYLATILVCQGCGGTRTNARSEIPEPVQAEFWDSPNVERRTLGDWLDEHPVVKYGGLTCLIGTVVMGVAVIVTPLVVFATAKRL
jgi:hypothetical protein